MTSSFDQRREVSLNGEFMRLNLFPYNCNNNYDDDNNNCDYNISTGKNNNSILFMPGK